MERIQDGSRKSGRSLLSSDLSSWIQWYLYPSSSPPSAHSPVSRTFLMPFWRTFEILRIDHQYLDARFQVDTIPNSSVRQFVLRVYGRRSVLRHGIQSFLLRVLSIALSVTSYCQLFRGFELVRCPTCCPNDRALPRRIHSFPPHYISNPKPLFIFYIIHGSLKIVVSPGAEGSTSMSAQAGLQSIVEWGGVINTASAIQIFITVEALSALDYSKFCERIHELKSWARSRWAAWPHITCGSISSLRHYLFIHKRT